MFDYFLFLRCDLELVCQVFFHNFFINSFLANKKYNITNEFEKEYIRLIMGVIVLIIISFLGKVII